MESKEIIGYKRFDSDLKFRGFQYKIGMEYKEEKAEVSFEEWITNRMLNY